MATVSSGKRRTKTLSTKLGTKFDQEKDRWDLLPFAQLTSVVKVLTMGAKVYGENNWKKLTNAKNRYFAAACRHLADWKEGKRIEEDSGQSPLVHAICCLIFLLWFERKGRKKKNG